MLIRCPPFSAGDPNGRPRPAPAYVSTTLTPIPFTVEGTGSPAPPLHSFRSFPQIAQAHRHERYLRTLPNRNGEPESTGLFMPSRSPTPTSLNASLVSPPPPPSPPQTSRRAAATARHAPSSTTSSQSSSPRKAVNATPLRSAPPRGKRQWDAAWNRRIRCAAVGLLARSSGLCNAPRRVSDF